MTLEERINEIKKSDSMADVRKQAYIKKIEKEYSKYANCLNFNTMEIRAEVMDGALDDHNLSDIGDNFPVISIPDIEEEILHGIYHFIEEQKKDEFWGMVNIIEIFDYFDFGEELCDAEACEDFLNFLFEKEDFKNPDELKKMVSFYLYDNEAASFLGDDWTLAVSAKVRCPKILEYFKEFLETEEGQYVVVDPEKYKKYMPTKEGDKAMNKEDVQKYYDAYKKYYEDEGAVDDDFIEFIKDFKAMEDCKTNGELADWFNDYIYDKGLAEESLYDIIDGKSEDFESIEEWIEEVDMQFEDIALWIEQVANGDIDRDEPVSEDKRNELEEKFAYEEYEDGEDFFQVCKEVRENDIKTIKKPTVKPVSKQVGKE